MSGKPREDRSTVTRHHLGLRLTDEEHAALVGIVDDTNAKLADQGLPPMMNQTRQVKMLIKEEASRRGLGAKKKR